MKIENNGISPLPANRSEATQRVEKKRDLTNVSATQGGQDKAEMSENARLLAKARAALGSVEETDSARLAALKQQIESGDYTIQVSELARKLLPRLQKK